MAEPLRHHIDDGKPHRLLQVGRTFGHEALPRCAARSLLAGPDQLHGSDQRAHFLVKICTSTMSVSRPSGYRPARHGRGRTTRIEAACRGETSRKVRSARVLFKGCYVNLDAELTFSSAKCRDARDEVARSAVERCQCRWRPLQRAGWRKCHGAHLGGCRPFGCNLGVDLERQFQIYAVALEQHNVLLKRHGVDLELSLEEFNAEVAPERPTPAEVSSVTLRDHFRPPLGTQRHWHSFHSAWATAIAAGLNQRLPEGYFAEPNVQFGIEIDVATFEETGPSAPSGTSPLAGGLDSGWSAPAPVRTIPLALLTDMVEVQIFTKEGGPTLVGAVELVSPANKDRAAHRDAFVSKCAAHLQQAVGLAIVDVVTERLANLHDELLARVGEPVGLRPRRAVCGCVPARRTKRAAPAGSLARAAGGGPPAPGAAAVVAPRAVSAP